ncbi:MAG: adenylate/guanylate cyclase domain-containing protein [Elusimicrobia bacterium]|nr:adenylate/guanylate cyclase domain-containing protein [Elusimicrobiota bacterium]
MNIGIGLGQDPDPERAAADAVRQARRTVPDPGLALAFGHIRMDQNRLHRALCREIDPGLLLGGSCYAHITNAGVGKDGVAVLLASFDGPGLRISGADIGADQRETGRALARALPPRPAGGKAVGLTFAGITNGREQELLRGIEDVLGAAPLFGGLCCGDFDLGMRHPDFWTNYQYSGPRLTKAAARLAWLDLDAADLGAAFGFAHGWQPVGPVVEFTRCRGNKVYAVDGMPVMDYYRQFLGTGHSDKFFELMIQRYGFSLQVEGDARSRVKLPVACDFEDGGIAYAPFEELQGRKARLLLSSRAGLLQGAREAAQNCLRALGGRKPDLILAVSCCGRSAILHSRVDQEIEVVRSVLGADAPIFGCYSGGEFGPCLSRYEEIVDRSQPSRGSQYHTTTICLLALKAGRPAVASVPMPAARPGSAGDAARLRDLLAKSEDIQDDTELFLANLSRKSYEDGERLRRQNEVIHRYTPHQVWTRVGEGAARGEFELPDSEFRGCFLFLDVKGFTGYSEDHGPSDVVSALNAIFKPATEAIYACGGDVDKFIGDCIFAVFSEPEPALRAGRRLLELSRELQARGSPFAVRIGINSGRAVRANVGSRERREYTFIGDAVNTAQRLEANCAPGRLLVCEELYGLAGKLFASAERKELKVKGKKNVVTCYELGL